MVTPCATPWPHASLPTMSNEREEARSASLPPFVQSRRTSATRTSFRGWAMVSGRRLYGPSRQTAGEAHKDALRLRAADDATPDVVRTIGQAAEAMHLELRSSCRPGTIEFYEQQARAVFRFIDPNLPLALLTPKVLQQLILLALRGEFSARTISHYRRWLNRLIGWCSMPQRQWFRGANPVPQVSWPEARNGQPDVIAETDIASKLAVIREEAPADCDLVVFLALTGLRRSELARLHTRDFDLRLSTFFVTGKNRNASAPITEQLRPIAEALLERAAGGWIVAGENERRRVQTIDRLFRRWSARFQDRRFHPHALRHSLATNLIRNGVAPGLVQRVMRHNSFATTQRYVHLVAEDLHEAASRLRYVTAPPQA